MVRCARKKSASGNRIGEDTIIIVAERRAG